MKLGIKAGVKLNNILSDILSEELGSKLRRYMSIAKFRQFLPLTAIMIALIFTFSSCQSSGSGDVLGSAKNGKKITDEDFVDLRAYCPKTKIRAGTETLRIYPKGVKKDAEDAAKKLRFQATIQEVVRECNYISETLAIRVGIAGRLINGPAGEVGELTLPIRVVVTRGDDVLYSQLHKISSKIEPGRSLAKFRFVDEAVNIDKPEKENIQIYVGFDEGPYNTP